MNAYKVLLQTNAGLMSCVAAGPLARVYVPGETVSFGMRPGMAFRTLANAQDFVDNAQWGTPSRKLVVYRAEVEPSPLQPSRVLAAESLYHHAVMAFWASMFRDDPLPQGGVLIRTLDGTIFCSTIRILEEMP